MLFRVDLNTKNASMIGPTSFVSLGIWERRDIQEWITKEPRLLDEHLYIITTEFNKFDLSKDRLDMLGVDPSGNLVVIELKRDQAAAYADLQAIRYAAMVSTLTLDDLATEHILHLKKSGKVVSKDQAAALILDSIKFESQEDREVFEFNDKPRIILASENFSAEITTTILWLTNQFGVSIKCVRLTPHRIDATVVISSQTIIPLPEASEYQVGIRRKETEKEEKAEKRDRRVNTATYLLEHGLIKRGQKLTFRKNLPTYVNFFEGSSLFEAEVVGESSRQFLRWAKDHELYSISGLASLILTEAHPQKRQPLSVNGNVHWAVEGNGASLWDLVESHVARVGGTGFVSSEPPTTEPTPDE